MIILATLISNPYKALAQQHIAALSAIESTLTPGMTLQDLIDEIALFINPLYFPTPDTFDQSELSAIIPNAIDMYINTNIEGYDQDQSYFISLLRNGIFEIAPNSIADFLNDVNNNVLKSTMQKRRQIPLLIAISIANVSLEYWATQIDNGSSSWYTNGYFNSNSFVNYSNLPYVIDACISGTLSSANMAKSYGQLDPPRVIGVDMVSALMGSIALSAGKVMFNWLPRIQIDIAPGGVGTTPRIKVKRSGPTRYRINGVDHLAEWDRRGLDTKRNNDEVWVEYGPDIWNSP